MNAVPLLPTAGEFAGRVAVVTGGTDGVGRHLTEALVTLGAEVFFCGTRAAKGVEVVAELGARAHYVQVDLRDTGATAAFVAAAGGHRGRIDYLINNAANDPRTPLEEATVEEFDRLIAINLRPYFVTSKAALAFLKKGEGKAVVNLCTTNYMLGHVPFTLYNAAKSGIVGFTRSLAREVGVWGIRANTVSPGWIMTSKQLREHVTEEDKKELLATQAMKFLLTEEHVTPLTLFLLSAAARGITGQNVVVDGGKVMQ